MAELPREPNDTTDTDAGGDVPPAAPRWVKVFCIIAVIFILVFVVLHLTGRGMGGMHGR
jgi:hypothetical protein